MLLKGTDLSLRGTDDKGSKKFSELEMDNSNWLPFEVICSPSPEMGPPGQEVGLVNLYSPFQHKDSKIV